MIGTETADNVEIAYYDGFRDLVATKSFRIGEVILALPEKTQPNPDKYSIEVMPGVHVDCAESFVGAINHSCTPNAAVRNGRIVAWACIQVGDSIVIDYKRTESKLAEPFDCQCGHQLCLGRIE